MRKLRTDFPGAIHHVYVRGNNKQPIFRDDDDCLFFTNRLRKLKKEAEFRLYSLGLMGNHFHMLPETRAVPLRTIMTRLLTPYSMRFNRKYGTVGHVFQDRYNAKLCNRDGYFVRLLRYINRNPVAAKMVKMPGDWPWSSHRDLVSGQSDLIDCEFPLSFFGTDIEEARRAYAAYAEDSSDDGWEPSTLDEALIDGPNQPILELLHTVVTELGVSLSDITSGDRKRTSTEARRAIARKGHEAGYSQMQIARALRCTDSAVSYLLRTGN